MPQTIEKYRILVASPSDVRDEREAMNEVIAELNHTYGSRANVILELIKWETHSAPAASQSDVQDSIDKDLGNDYDLFVGILWKKFGTPTEKYGSGTEQEFRNAHSRFKKEPNSLQILFYFKNAAPHSLSDIDPKQLEKVNLFKSEIGNKGIYYWEYTTVDELQKYLRIHIPKRIDDLKDKSISPDIKVSDSTTDDNIPEEELGIIDYQEIVEESFGDSKQAMMRIGKATEWVGKEITRKSTELNKLTARKQEVGKKTQRNFFKRTADIMNDFASRIEPDIPIFINNFESGVNALSSLINLSHSDFKNFKEGEIEQLIVFTNDLMKSIEGGLANVVSFYKSVSELPRMEKELIRSRRNVEAKLGELISKLEVSYSIANELKINLEKINIVPTNV